MTSLLARVAVWPLLLAGAALAADPKQPAEPKKPAEPVSYRHRVLGLFCPERADDLRAAVAKIPSVELVSVDVDRGEAEFRYDARTAFNTDQPPQALERLDTALRGQSRSTFSAKPRIEIADADAATVEIGVAGLDCRGCQYGAYRAIYQIDGVLAATVDFKTGIVRARIDPKQTNREALVAALKKRDVTVVAAPSAAK